MNALRHFQSKAIGNALLRTLVLVACALLSSCSKKSSQEVIVYCGVDEPYAKELFAQFEKETGIHVVAQYDIEASRSVGLATRLEAEKDSPRADVYWSNEPFLSGHLAAVGVLDTYRSPSAADIPNIYKDPEGFWAGVGIRARVLAVGKVPPPFAITGIADLADPRLKGKVVMCKPTSGATRAHIAALYVLWGPDKMRDYLHKLRDNQIALVGGNSEVAHQIGLGTFLLGLTDNDDITDAQDGGATISMIIPDQGPDDQGTLALPSTVCLVKGAHNPDNARKLIDFLLSKQAEQKLIDVKFARWSVRGGVNGQIKAMKIDYRKVVEFSEQAQKEALDILEGRVP